MVIHESESCMESCSTQGNGGYTRNRGGNVEHQVGYNRTPTLFWSKEKITGLDAWTCAVSPNMIQIDSMPNVIRPQRKIWNNKYLEMPLFEITESVEIWDFFSLFPSYFFQTHIVTSKPFVGLHIAPLMYFLSQWRIHCETVVYGPSVRN